MAASFRFRYPEILPLLLRARFPIPPYSELPSKVAKANAAVAAAATGSPGRANPGVSATATVTFPDGGGTFPDGAAAVVR